MRIPLLEHRKGDYAKLCIVSKERTEGGLNKRAISCAPLFSTLLVFPNWTKSRPVYGDSIVPSSSICRIEKTFWGHVLFLNPVLFWILGTVPPFPHSSVSAVLTFYLYQALFIWCRCFLYEGHFWYDTLPPQHGHFVTSFLYSILTACTLSSFLNRLRNSRQPIRFLQTGISFRLLWLLKIP